MFFVPPDVIMSVRQSRTEARAIWLAGPKPVTRFSEGTGRGENEKRNRPLFSMMEVSRLVGKKRIDWAAIQAEYIGGNIGQKRLAEKHGIEVPTNSRYLRRILEMEAAYPGRE